jgi:hypothetical protein
MVEWMIGFYANGENNPHIAMAGLKTFKEAMEALRAIIDRYVVATPNPYEHSEFKYKSVNDVPIKYQYVIFKVTKTINYDIKCELKLKATPKELKDMVQAPKNGGQ